MIKICDHLIFVSNERRVLYHFSGKHTFKVLQDFAYIPIRLLAKRKLSIAFLVGFTRSYIELIYYSYEHFVHKI